MLSLPPLPPPCSHVDGRVEAFLAAYESRLAGLSADEFEKHKTALASTKLQKDRWGGGHSASMAGAAGGRRQGCGRVTYDGPGRLRRPLLTDGPRCLPFMSSV